MSMTHYMELLSTNQPWNLLIFMAIPIVLAETIAVTELVVLFTRNFGGFVRFLNRWAGILVGLIFTGIFLYLMATVAVPLTISGGWRGPVDMVAVGFYLFGIVPLGSIALLEFGKIGRGRDDMSRLKLHATLVGLFLITAHVAMIAGMLDPKVIAGLGMAGMSHG